MNPSTINNQSPSLRPPLTKPFAVLIITFSILVISSRLSTPGKTQNIRCDPTLKPIDGSFGYMKRDNRCEGFYKLPTAGGGLDIVSVLRGKLSYSLHPAAALEIRTAATLNENENVTVRGVSANTDGHYRMDAVISPGKALVLPLGDVIVPNKMKANEIGLFGWIGLEENKTFVPLTVLHGRISPEDNKTFVPDPVPQKRGAVADKNELYLTILTSEALDRMDWSIMKDCSDCEKCGGLVSKPSGDHPQYKEYKAGEAISIKLPSDAKTNLCVFIQIRKKDSDYWPSLLVKVRT